MLELILDDALVAKQASPEIPPLLVKDDNDNLVPLEKTTYISFFD